MFYLCKFLKSSSNEINYCSFEIVVIFTFLMKAYIKDGCSSFQRLTVKVQSDVVSGMEG